MRIAVRFRFLFGYVFVALMLWFQSATNATALAQDGQSGYVRLVRSIKTWKLGFPSPAGLAFSPRANAFIVLEADSARDSRNNAATLILMSPVRELLGSESLTGSTVSPLNMVFDVREQRLLVFDSSKKQLLEINTSPRGFPEPTVLTRFDAQQFALQNPRGMTIDPDGNLIILDTSPARIVRVSPGHDRGFDGKVAAQEGRISQVNLGNPGLRDVRGIAFNPANGNLYLLSPSLQTLYELTLSGAIVSTRDLKDVVKLWNPQGMVFAPSGDQTDDPGQLSLYIADSGPSPAARHGKITELSLTQSVQLDVSAATQQTSLVRFTDTAAWPTPSTDPADITYLPDSNTLLISDSEIEEYLQPWWHGGNLFETDLAGNLLRIATTTLNGACTSSVPSPPSDGSYTTPDNFSNEPCGMVFHKLADNTNHLLFSDDDDLTVYHVDLGADGHYGGGNDQVSKLFATKPCGSTDPEGLTVDTRRNHIMLVDGMNSEIYDIDPGPNGTFDGCGTGSDDVVTHFDTSTIPGCLDLEGITFDPDTGHIFVTGNAAAIDRSVVELTVTGDVVRRFHVPGIETPAGITIAPGSVDPSVKSLYIVDRGQDNDSYPDENDGRMFEISLSPTPLDKIFSDGFESGNIRAWNYNSPTGNGLLSVSSAAAMVGAKGLQITIADTTALYVDDEWPDAESYYRASFYFNPNSIAMANGDAHYIFQGYMVESTGSSAVLRVEFRFSGGKYQLRAGVLDDAGSFASTNWSNIGIGPHKIELEWQAASAASANDGYLSFSLDGAQVASLTGVDNDTRRVDRIRMGAVSGIDTGTRGTYYFDQFESYRTSPAVNHPPVADAQSVTTTENTATTITLTGSDPDGDKLTFSVVSGPTHGILSGAAPNLTYTPGSGYSGPDSFTFKANDGKVDSSIATVTIAITVPNHAPVASSQSVTVAENSAIAITLTATDQDNDALTYSLVTGPGHGTLSGPAPNLTYTPVANYYGSDSFTFKANDGKADSNQATVSITVTNFNQPPVANNQAVTTNENTPIAITLTATDQNNDALTYSVVTMPQQGTLSGTAPNLTYTPVANYYGSDSFTFKANDGQIDSNAATVTITVQRANRAPTVNAGVDQTVPLPPGTATLTGTASDDGLPNPPASLTVTWSKVTGPGSVKFGNAKALNTTAAFSKAGIYTLRLTVSDGALSSSDDVIVTVRKP